MPTDNFDRADYSDLGANWTKTSDLAQPRIASNAVTSASGGSDSGAYYSAGTAPSADHWSELKITTTSDGGPAVRCTADGCYYLAGSSGSNSIYRFKTGANWLQIGAALNITYGATDVVRLEATGTSTTTLKVYVNGVQQGTDRTDSSTPLTTGYYGLYVAGSTVVDDWQGGEVAAAATLTQLATRARNDDGSESAATTIADGNFTAPLDNNVRVRFQIDATNDPAATTYQLEAQKSGDAGWSKVT